MPAEEGPRGERRRTRPGSPAPGAGSLTTTRRGALAAASALFAGATVSACGNPVVAGFTGRPEDSRRLTYWNLLAGGDGVRMKEMEAAYEREHPEIDLNSVTLTWGNPFYTKLSLATLGARPPHVAVAHLSRVPSLVQAGILDPIPDDLLRKHELTTGRFVPRAIRKATIGGEIYAIPMDTHPFVLYYNTDICEKAGLLDSDGQLRPLDGEDAFIEALVKAKEVSGAWGASFGVVADSASPWRMFSTLYSQLGGRLLAGNSSDHVLDTDLALRVARFMRRLTVEEELIPRTQDGDGSIALFANGRAGFFFTGVWEVSTFLDAKLPFSMQRFPHLFGRRYAVQADSHTFVLPRQRSDDMVHRDAAVGFARSMLDQGITWAEGGHIPTWLPTQERPEYRDLKPQSNYASVAEYAAYDPPAWFAGSGSNLWVITGSALGEVLAGRVEPEVAIAKVQDQISTLARTASPI